MDMRLWIVAGSIALSGGAAADSLSDALADGKVFATAHATAGRSFIQETDTATLPGYTTTAPQATSFGTGLSLTQLGSSKITSCASYTPSADKAANQECDAVNFLARNPYERKTFDVSRNDPIFTRPDLTVASKFLDGNSDNCVPKTVTSGGTERTDICHEYVYEVPPICTVGRVVEVGAQYNYNCDVAKYVIEHPTCDRILLSAGKASCPTAIAQKRVFSMSGNIDHELQLVIQVATTSGSSWSGWGYRSTLQNAVASVGGYYAETRETMHGDLPASISYSPVSLPTISVDQLISATVQFRKISGTVPDISVTQQPTKDNGWVAVLSFYTPASGEQTINGELWIVPDMCTVETWDTSSCDLLSANPVCAKSGAVCVEGPETRNISGLDLYASCWRYRDTYDCTKDDFVDYCSAIANTAGCWLSGSVCSKSDFRGTCVTNTNAYRCGAAFNPAPANVVTLDTTYTVVKDTLDYSSCKFLTDNPSCKLASHTCADSGGTRVINGLPVTKDCWEWTDSYSCVGITDSDCFQLEEKGCKLSNKRCVSEIATGGSCTDYELTYTCPVAGTTTTINDCSARVACVSSGSGGQDCFDSSSPADTDFARTVATLEAARQAGVYGSGFKLFSGVGETCTSKNMGLATKCCRASGGAKSNNDLLGGAVGAAGMSAVSSAGSAAWSAGSEYVYDFMYSSNVAWLQDRAIAAWQSAGGGAGSLTCAAPGGFTPSISYMGFTVTSGTPLIQTGTTMVGNLGSVGGMNFNLYFNPYLFALAVAIMVYQELVSCDDAEISLGMHRGAGLCEFVNTECHGKVLKTCKENYCCYNSKLARIINEQGKAQIGKEKGDCSGFTSEEFEKLDFSKIDMAEFLGDVMNAVKVPSQSSLATQVDATVQKKVSDFYGK